MITLSQKYKRFLTKNMIIKKKQKIDIEACVAKKAKCEKI